MLYKKTQLKGIRDRLKEGKLSAKDQKIIDDLLTGAEEIASLQPVKGKGKRVVARLPFGMDIVK